MGEQKKRTFTLSKLVDSSGLNIVGNIWNGVRTQLNNTYIKCLFSDILMKKCYILYIFYKKCGDIARFVNTHIIICVFIQMSFVFLFM